MKKNCSSGRFSEYLTIRRKLILKMKLIIILICILVSCQYNYET